MPRTTTIRISASAVRRLSPPSARAPVPTSGQDRDRLASGAAEHRAAGGTPVTQHAPPDGARRCSVSTEVTSKDAEASSWFQPRARAAPEVTAAGNTAAGHPAPPAGHPAPPAGYRNGSDGQGNSSAARNGHGFADSQHDGLNAMIGIATAVSP